ncbi:MAG: tetratricopeptide repeat protein [Desulfobaccales bacterium]
MRKLLAVLGVAVLLWGCQRGPTAEEEARAWLEKGLQQFQNRQYSQAIDSLSRATASPPQAAAAYTLLGLAYRFHYYELRDQDLRAKEVEAYRRALAADPEYWLAHYHLGTTLYYDGEQAAAREHFRRVVALQPQHPDRAQLEEMIAAGETP